MDYVTRGSRYAFTYIHIVCTCVPETLGRTDDQTVITLAWVHSLACLGWVRLA